MGFKKFIKKVGKAVGKVASVASHVVPIPGVKQALAVGGSVLQGNNRKEHLGALLKSAIPVPGLGGLASKIPGVGGVISKVAGKIPGVSGIAGKVGGAIKKIGLGGVGDLAKRGIDWIGDNPELAAAGASGLYGAYQGHKAGKMLDSIDPSRIANERLAQFDAQNEEGLRRRIQHAGRQASKFGTLGHGETGRYVGEIARNHEYDRAALAHGLAADTAAMDIDHRYAQADRHQDSAGGAMDNIGELLRLWALRKKQQPNAPVNVGGIPGVGAPVY